MARSDYSQTDASLVDEGYNSAGSQFFIMTENNTSLDGLYAAFGRVIEGMDIVEKIENVKENSAEIFKTLPDILSRNFPVISYIFFETKISS